MQLVYEDTKVPVKVGDRALTFRGEAVVVTGMTEPHKPSSTGRVHVKFSAIDNFSSEYYPAVIGAVWVNREDRI